MKVKIQEKKEVNGLSFRKTIEFDFAELQKLDFELADIFGKFLDRYMTVKSPADSDS